MKKTLLVILLILVVAFTFIACDAVDTLNEAAKDGDAAHSGESYGYADDAIYSGSEGIAGIHHSISGKATLAGEGSVAFDGEGESNGEPTPRAGLLTACAYDDHEFASYWQGLLTSNQEGKGIFADYFDNFAFKAFFQVTVTVEGVAGAKVSLYQGETLLGKAVTNNAGVAYLFAPSRPQGLTVKAEVKKAGGDVLTLENEVENNAVTFGKAELEGVEEHAFETIQIMFVIDTTGSMGDEIRYLKEEIDDVIGRIQEQTGATVLLSIMVYRDLGDDYVTDYSDFSTDIEAQQAYLKNQDADGGGDFPEAVDVALTQAVDKQWSAGATKIIVHVADAPSHDDDVPTWNTAAAKAAEKGIRIVSVASSGIDKQTEYFFRSQSLLTGGVYVWLTNDSGIGGNHLEGTVEKRPAVEPLNDCIVRVISSLHTGEKEITVFPQEDTQDPEQQGEEQGEGQDQ